MKRKLTRSSIDEIQKEMLLLNSTEERRVIGGGNRIQISGGDIFNRIYSVKSSLVMLNHLISYGTAIRNMRHYTSFIGTSNQKDLLTTPSGSRCFICIEVTAPIETTVNIRYHQLCARVMHGIVKGERYWLNISSTKYRFRMGNV